MSVRMAIAKLCACACGGAVIGGGAVHYAEHPHRVHRAAVRHVAVQRARHVTTTTTTCTPGSVTVASAGAPIEAPAYGGGAFAPGYGGGYGGGNGFGGGGFWGGGGGGSGGWISSTSGGHDKPPHDKPPHDKPPHDNPPHDNPPHDNPPHDVPAPPMLLLFGGAAMALVARRKFAIRKPA